MSHSEKRYACARCGHEALQKTNHYGSTYSAGRYNACPACPPWAKFAEYGGGTVWYCLDAAPFYLMGQDTLRLQDTPRFATEDEAYDWVAANLGADAWNDTAILSRYETPLPPPSEIPS